MMKEKTFVFLTLFTFSRHSLQLSSALPSVYELNSLNCKQYGPNSDCFLKSSLIRVYRFAAMVKVLRSAFEYMHHDVISRHFQDKKMAG